MPFYRCIACHDHFKTAGGNKILVSVLRQTDIQFREWGSKTLNKIIHNANHFAEKTSMRETIQLIARDGSQNECLCAF